jgi:ankyrin repeat protein
MLTHISCRFDAFNCLDYLLKHQFIESPVKYIDYVNAQNIDGSTCLHLCGIWKADKCFNVLYFYGGLHLTASDKNRKTPLEMAIQNRCKKMVDILQNHRDQGISFTLVET